LDSGVEVYSRSCPLFVPLVEEGWLDHPVVNMTVESYLGSLKQSGIDTLILGCTHYPLLKKAIRKFMGRGVELVDSAEETAKAVGAILRQRSLGRTRGKGSASFFVTDVPDRFVKGKRPSSPQLPQFVRANLPSCISAPESCILNLVCFV